MLHRLRQSTLWNVVFRHPVPHDRRSRAGVIFANFFLHVHPAAIRRSAVHPGFTWCMGGITFFLFLVEVITGVLLMFYYRPTVEYAYADMVSLRSTVSFGVMREMHRWAAHAMVIAVWLHMLRVFLTGSYRHPREFNWIIGVLLLVLTLLLSFTGYLLPWDQLSLWAVTVGTNMASAAPIVGAAGPGSTAMVFPGTEAAIIHPGSDARFFLLGGTAVGEAALLRFYVLHCIALPLLLTILCGVHFWRVRKDGGISGPL